MWYWYSRNVQANTPINLDYLVGRKAFEDGHNQKEIGLMLTAGSPYVRQIHQEQGKNKARIYVSQTVRAVCEERQQQQIERQKTRSFEMEI
ncbi:MAG: hypothetical protein HC827_22120 [Cyanobacteria bacterium RM1_2_2]|nr:hypothetical protein [Cyanobacteria bacterium RM1_2_2]